MPRSYKKIDYRLRPAKSIERKMFAETIRRLSPFARVDSYRYVGFGSINFVDFSLFHKLFGFRDMISIEDASDSVVQERFEFNRPYNSISMKFGSSKDMLPKLSWDARSLFWLDYDTTLTSEILGDIDIIASKAQSGTMLIVSVCIPSPAIPSEDDEGSSASPLTSLRKAVGADRMPPNLKNSDFAGWGTAKVYRTLINNQILESLKNRNGVLGEFTKLNYEQIFNFHYADGMKILSLGGLFFDEGQRNIFNTCGFSDLDFYRPTDDAYLIDPPLLTFREMQWLERDFPDHPNPAALPVSNADIEKYKKLYRFFPTFAEAEI